MAERLKAQLSKSCMAEMSSRVQIPIPPLFIAVKKEGSPPEADPPRAENHSASANFYFSLKIKKIFEKMFIVWLVFLKFLV